MKPKQTKQEKQPKPAKQEFRIVFAEEEARKAEERAKVNARVTLSSHSGAALVADAYKTLKTADIKELQNQLAEQCIRVNGGDLKRAESMLISQAHSLDVIFTRLALDASANSPSNMEAFQTFLKLALRAQSQCRATLETLATIKNPPIFARQANIAHGPQQVNNEAGRVRAEQIEKPQTELLEHDDGNWLDTGTTTAAIGSDKALEAVGALHRPANG
jgi:hypothetical protein